MTDKPERFEHFEAASLKSDGAWVLGHNQSQGGSILQAGGRALLIPSKLTTALSTPAGRISARTMMLMGVSELLMNYAAFRPFAIMEAVRRCLPEGVPQPIIVDPAAGYAPELIWLAEEMPHARFIEIDRPATMQDKRHRLRSFNLPPNLDMIEADLSSHYLHHVLDDQRPDVVIALAAYVKPADFVELLHYLRQVMSDKGRVVALFAYAPGVDDLARNSAMFRRLAGEPVGIVESELAIQGTFRMAGYHNVTLYKLSDMARELEKPIPADIEMVAIAHANPS